RETAHRPKRGGLGHMFYADVVERAAEELDPGLDEESMEGFSDELKPADSTLPLPHQLLMGSSRSLPAVLQGRNPLFDLAGEVRQVRHRTLRSWSIAARPLASGDGARRRTAVPTMSPRTRRPRARRISVG